MTTELQRIATADEILARLQQNRTDFIETARLYASAVEANPAIKEELHEKGLSMDLLTRLELFGRGQIIPQLFEATFPAARRLMLLPVSDQRTAVSDGVEVMDDDEQTTRRIPIEAMTAKQVAQVFRNGHIASLAEQRTVIRQRKAEQKLPSRDKAAVQVKGQTVIIREPGVYSKDELLAWLARM